MVGVLGGPEVRKAEKRAHTARESLSGEGMPIGDLPGWRQVFADDFDTDVPLGEFPATVRERWFAYPEGWLDTSRNGHYAPGRVISAGGGVLRIGVRNDGTRNLVSAPVPRLHGPGVQGGLRYGRYAVRFRADPVPGFKVAWLLWPDSERWADGEIDFPEGELDGTIGAFLHHRGDPEEQQVFTSGATFTRWHTAVIEWTSAEVRFLLDGEPLGRVTDRAIIPDRPMHWVLQTETALSGRRPEHGVAGHVELDWVAAYALDVPE